MSGTLSFVLAMLYILVLDMLHRRAISSSVRCVERFSALTVALVSSGILFLPGMFQDISR